MARTKTTPRIIKGTKGTNDEDKVPDHDQEMRKTDQNRVKASRKRVDGKRNRGVEIRGGAKKQKACATLSDSSEDPSEDNEGRRKEEEEAASRVQVHGRGKQLNLYVEAKGGEPQNSSSEENKESSEEEEGAASGVQVQGRGKQLNLYVKAQGGKPKNSSSEDNEDLSEDEEEERPRGKQLSLHASKFNRRQVMTDQCRGKMLGKQMLQNDDHYDDEEDRGEDGDDDDGDGNGDEANEENVPKRRTIEAGAWNNYVQILTETFPAGLLPCLVLHGKSPEGLEPNTYFCDWNIRSADKKRVLSPGEQETDCMVHKLYQESPNAPSILAGQKMQLALTTLTSKNISKVKELSTEMIMMSSGKIERTEEIFVVDNSLEQPNTLIEAIGWISCDEQLPPATTPISSLVQTYLRKLSEAVPLLQNFTGLKKFITEHDWGAGNDEKERLGELTDTVQNCFMLRRFIHENLARRTRVVVQPVDGIHRLQSVCSILAGYGLTPEQKTSYSSSYHHGREVITADLILPEKIGNPGKLIDWMKGKSDENQLRTCDLIAHGLKDFLSSTLSELDKYCQDNGVGFLFGGDRTGLSPKGLSDVGYIRYGRRFNKKSFTKVALLERLLNEAIVKKSSQINNIEESLHNPPMAGTVYIRCWIEAMSEAIKETLKQSPNKSMIRNLIDIDQLCSNDELWDNLFIPNNEQEKKNFGYLFGNKNRTVAYFLSERKDIYSKTRYHKKITSQAIELVQILLWSRLSKTTQECLLLFVKEGPQDIQDNKMIAVSPEHVSRWLSCSLHCVILSVYYSEEIWRCAFPTYFPNNCQVLEFCLLMSSIEHNLRFFSHKGPNPSEPYLCQVLRKDINCKINNGALTPEDINSPIPDYLTSLSLLHALHMEHNVMPNIDPK